MRIVVVRRICQGFFLALFFWFCVTATVGDQWWRLRGWPVNWLLQLDPLTALATLLATGTWYGPLLWSLAVLAPTLFLGRIFCGFVCPLGSLNQLAGWLFRRKAGRGELAEANRHRPLQAAKYHLLLAFLFCAALGSVQTGLLDPLPLLHRSVNLALAPLADPGRGVLHDAARRYDAAWLLGAVLALVLGLNLVLPRFFCRFLCPLGALYGLAARFTPWRIGKTSDRCGDCRICEERCEGACRPSGRIVTGECLLCLNCLDRCPARRITFAGKPSAAGETPLPDLSRRGAILAGTGLLLTPLWQVGGLAGTGRDPRLIRPPGALDEERFLERCIRCGQCMRGCPSNLIQPVLLQAGVQGLWSPALDFRLGRSGCQPSCVACGNLCPTAAIRALTPEEKQGRGAFDEAGPVRLGTAFVDRSRCLPWAMDRPCIVCEEVCPVSPKAIFTRTVFEPVRGGRNLAVRIAGKDAEPQSPPLAGADLTGGDYFLRPSGREEARPVRIAGWSGRTMHLEEPLPATAKADLLVRLQRPFIDPARCTGCGICEHDCPVSGLRAIRVTSENESRSPGGRMLVRM